MSQGVQSSISAQLYDLVEVAAKSIFGSYPAAFCHSFNVIVFVLTTSLRKFNQLVLELLVW